MISLDSEEIFALSLDIGEGIIRSGGEVHRAEDTIKRINASYEQDCRVFALPTLIVAQSKKNTEIRKIEREDTDLAELDRLNDLSRRICLEDYSEIKATSKKLYSTAHNALAIFTATFCYCIFFGGRFREAILSGTIGLIISYTDYKKIRLPLFCSNLIDAFVSALLAQLPKMLGIDIRYDKVIIGTIMLLVPGLTVVNSMRDMMSGDMLAGLIELFSSIMSALGIAFGVAGALLIFKGI